MLSRLPNQSTHALVKKASHRKSWPNFSRLTLIYPSDVDPTVPTPRTATVAPAPDLETGKRRGTGVTSSSSRARAPQDASRCRDSRGAPHLAGGSGHPFPARRQPFLPQLRRHPPGAGAFLLGSLSSSLPRAPPRAPVMSGGNGWSPLSSHGFGYVSLAVPVRWLLHCRFGSIPFDLRGGRHLEIS